MDVMDNTVQPNSDQSPAVRAPLFQEWMQANPHVFEHIGSRDWYRFLQHLLRSLKSGSDEPVYAFLDSVLPRLVREQISYQTVAGALTHLRALLLGQLLMNGRGGKRTALLNRLLDTFDRILQVVQANYAVKQLRHAGSAASPQTFAFDQLSIIAFYIEDFRFGGSVDFNSAFLDHTGVDPDAFLEHPDWEPLIHPDDYQRVVETVAHRSAERQPLYEIEFRLRNHRGDYVPVTELTRIHYDGGGKPATYAGIIIERGQAGQRSALLNSILDEQDIALLLDDRGVAVHVTNRLQHYIDQQSQPLNRILTDRDSTFFDGLDSENVVEARDFWQAMRQGREDRRTMLLRFSNGSVGSQYFLEFRPIYLERAFGAPHWLLWGEPRQRQGAPRELLLERLTLLHGIGRDFSRLRNYPGLYQRLMAGLRQLFPAIEVLGLLIRSGEGFLYASGQGFPKPDGQHLKVIDTELAAALDAQTERGIGLSLSGGGLRRELLERLFSFRGEAPAAVERDDQHLVGLVPSGDGVRAILVLSQNRAGRTFDEMDRTVFRILMQGAADTLARLNLDHRLAEAETNYTTLYQKSPLAMCILHQGAVQLFNPSFLELTGLEPDRALGQKIGTLLHPDDLRPFRNFLTASLGGNNDDGDFEFRIRTTGREWRHCLGSFQRIRFTGKSALLCEIRDVTRLRTLERQLMQSQKMESLGNLAINVAHDFNNILGAIIPNAQLLMREVDGPDTRKRAKAILYMAQRAAKITEQLLSYSGEEGEGPRIFNLNGLLQESRDLFEGMLGPGIAIHYDLAVDLPDISGDPRQVMQMMVNLIVNGRDAMPDGGDLAVTTRRRIVREPSPQLGNIAPGSYVELRVRDNDRGLPEAVRKQIFKPFFTTKGDRGAAGLGLAIVYGILERHEGSILVQSVEGEGTTFRIFLPVSGRKGLVPKSEPRADAPPAPAPTPRREGGGTILVVDDEEYLRDVLCSMAQLLGYNCLEAASGREAVSLFEHHKDDITFVVLDYAMPEMNGRKTYEALKKIDPELRVLLSTGYAEQKEITSITRQARVQFLPKPFTIERLSEKIQALMKES